MDESNASTIDVINILEHTFVFWGQPVTLRFLSTFELDEAELNIYYNILLKWESGREKAWAERESESSIIKHLIWMATQCCG